MANYGHELQFGVFLTPQNENPTTVIELAQLAERVGLDLVTFQDHPYQAKHLDTWTLLSWVAGKTERIHLSANVHSLPLRPPAMLARAAASLDLLSGGRFELALGAGAFWPAIAAMGGPRRRPGEAVEALSEAIDLIRALWDASEGRPLHFQGEHYHVAGAHPGPVPAHDIPIWVGARKPRMLRLIGQKADGWLPTLEFLKPGEFEAGNRIIDEAARAAGRDPREIRRLINISGRFSATREGFLVGPSEQWVNDLLPLVVEQGVGTVILMSDDPATIEQFATEVAPALRETAERAFPPGHFGARIRRASARARRREGIDYDAIPASLADAAIEPGDTAYALVKSTYLRGGSPGLVLPVRNTEEVIEAVAFARAHPNVPLSIRSGGHGISGRSTNDGGIVIDLSQMNTIEVLDPATRRVRLGPGARWMHVAKALAPYGWGLSSGDYGAVAVGGLATAGGIGWLSRKRGLTIDHLRAVEMVLADGSIVRASDDENADLFWAVRGAGANFGIVTSFEFEVYEVGHLGWAQFVFDARDMAGVLEKWGAVVESAPRDMTSFLLMGPPRLGQPPIAQVMAVVDSDQPETIIDRLQPLADIAPLYNQSVVITTYPSIMANAQEIPHNAQGEPVARSGLIEHLTPEFAAAAERLLRSRAVFFFQVRSVGGAVADVDPDATAYANRSANFHVTAFGVHRDRVNAVWDPLAKHFTGLYLNFETDQRPERLADAFPPRTLKRLRELKARFDPDNVFRDNFNIPPEANDR